LLFLMKVCDESLKTLILYGEVTSNAFGIIGDSGLQFADGRELFYVDKPGAGVVKGDLSLRNPNAGRSCGHPSDVACRPGVSRLPSL